MFVPVAKYDSFGSAIFKRNVVHIRPVRVAVQQYVDLVFFDECFYRLIIHVHDVFGDVLLRDRLCCRACLANAMRSSSDFAIIIACHSGLRTIVRSC